jgi:hypothetical protein
VPLHPPQITYGLTWVQTWASMGRSPPEPWPLLQLVLLGL